MHAAITTTPAPKNSLRHKYIRYKWAAIMCRWEQDDDCPPFSFYAYTIDELNERHEAGIT